MSNIETEMADAAKSEEKIRVYTELGLSKNPPANAKDTDYISIKSYFDNLLKQKHINSHIERIKGKPSSVNDDPHFSQFLHESAQSPDIAINATNKLITHEIKNANHDLLANVVAALIFEPSQNKKKLEEWGILVNDSAGLTDQGAQLWLNGVGKWKEDSLFKRVTYKLSDHRNNPKAITLPILFKSWGLEGPKDNDLLFEILKDEWKPKMKTFLVAKDASISQAMQLIEILNKMDTTGRTDILDAFLKSSTIPDDDKNKIQTIFSKLRQDKKK